MGMFDTITVIKLIPGLEPFRSYQTKSLECSMSYYLVKDDGYLHQVVYDIEAADEHGIRYREKNHGIKPVIYTGSVRCAVSSDERINLVFVSGHLRFVEKEIFGAYEDGQRSLGANVIYAADSFHDKWIVHCRDAVVHLGDREQAIELAKKMAIKNSDFHAYVYKAELSVLVDRAGETHIKYSKERGDCQERVEK